MSGITSETASPTLSGPGDFPVGDCQGCGRVVLAHLWLGDDGAEMHRCVHCDTSLADVRWIDEEELRETGYAAFAAEVGCGRPDCGRGRCGAG